jgi:succinyl-diaminopimelate desuccinylase
VVELGPINKTIHRVDENISVTDLDDLALIYQQVVSKLLL